MRPYHNRDFLRLYRYLESEGISPFGMAFFNAHTFVDDVGFYTYRIDHNGQQPWLIHFYIEPEHRSYTALYRMYQHFKKQLREKFPGYVVAVPDDKKYIEKFVHLTGSKTPYAHQDDKDFYYVPLEKEG